MYKRAVEVCLGLFCVTVYLPAAGRVKRTGYVTICMARQGDGYRRCIVRYVFTVTRCIK